MKRSNRLILLIGVFLAALAFVFVVVLLGGDGGGGTGTPSESAAPVEVDTVVAARDIPLGVTVTAAMVTTQKILVTQQEPQVYTSVTQAIGKTARQSITRGQQVTAVMFQSSGQIQNIECLEGFTCIAVQVDQVSGVGTLIKTGDYVDLIAQVSPTFPLNYFAENAQTPTSGGFLYDPVSVKMVLQGLQVVGTLLPPPPAPAEGAAPTAEPGTALTGQQEIVILAVTPQQAEVIKFIQVDGSITLALRSPKDFQDDQGNPIVPPTVETTGTILTTMIRDFGVLPPEPVIVPGPSPLP